MLWGSKNKEKSGLAGSYTQSAAGAGQTVEEAAKIPVFGQTTPERQAVLDRLVKTYSAGGMANAANARSFGGEALRQGGGVVEETMKAQKAANFGILNRPVQDLSGYVADADIDALSERTALILKDGSGVVKPGFLKKTFAAVVGVASEEKAARMREPDSIARVQSEARHIMLGLDPFLRDLQIAALGFPALQDRIVKIHGVNLSMLQNLSDHIAAGTEILRIYREETLPQAMRNPDNIEGYYNTEKAMQDFARQLVVLGNAHKSAVSNTLILDELRGAVVNTIRSVDTILNDEAGIIKNNLRAQHSMLETLDIMNLLGAYQEAAMDKAKTSVKAIDIHTKKLASNDNNTPEAIQEGVEYLQKTQQEVADIAKALPQIEKLRASLEDQLTKNAKELLNIQLQYADKTLEIARR